MQLSVIFLLFSALSQAITWTTKEPLPEVRSGPGCAVINDTVYVIGGQSGSGNETTNYVYDPVSDNWSTKSPMPTARRHLGCAVVKGKIYAIGGFVAGETNIVEEYDPVADSWQTKTPMPTPRYAFAIAVVANKIYVIGGYLTVKDRVEEYNPAADTAGGTPWQTKTSMPTARMGSGCAVIRDTIYVFGGYPTTKVNECYDPVTNDWATKAPLSVNRYTIGSFSYNNKAYSVGGQEGWPVAHYSANVEVYDPLSKGWSLETPMDYARQSVAVGLVGNKVYVIGGWNDAPLNYNEEGTFPITATELLSFDVISHNFYIKLRWSLASLNEVYQCIVKRSTIEDGDYSEIAAIPGSGSSPAPKNYSYTDREVKSGYTYYYKLGVVKTDGSTRWYGPVYAMVTGTKGYLKVSPNPFTSVVRVKCQVPSAKENISLNIYDISGRLVKSFPLTTDHSALSTAVSWDGRDDNGKLLPSGIYYCRLSTETDTRIEKILLIK